MDLDNDSTIEIPLSKGKAILMIVGAACFVFLGYLLVTGKMVSSQPTGSGIILAQIAPYAGIAGIVFFGLCLVVGIRKLFDHKPGLVINSEGIVDNSSGIPGGLIRWSEIEGFSVIQIQRTKLLAIHVSNPEQYMELGNSLQRMAKRASCSMYETPFTITSNALAISFDKLHALLEERLAKYREGVL